MKFNPTQYYARRKMKDLEDVNRLIYDIKVMGWPTPEQCEQFCEQIKRTCDEQLIEYYKRSVYDKQPHLKASKVLQEQTKKKKKNKVVYATSSITCMGKALIFMNGRIQYGNYVMNTKQAFAVHKSIMAKVEGAYRIKLCHDNTFYFEKGELPRLLIVVENACHDFISHQLKGWTKNKLEKINEYIAYVRDINFKVFVEIDTESFDEDTQTYKMSLKDIPFNLIDLQKEGEWKYEYESKVKDLVLIPSVYRESYIKTYPNPLHLNEINRTFRDEVISIIKENCSYTIDEYELDELYGKSKKGFNVSVKRANDTLGHVILLPYLSDSIDIMVKQIKNPGKLFHFTQDSKTSIKEAINGCQFNEYSRLDIQLDKCLKLINGDEKMTDYVVWRYPYFGYGGLNPLYNINDDRYEECHPRCDELFTNYIRGKYNNILYFRDPNAHCSSDNLYPFRCYLLVRGKYIVLFALNSDLSTYVFRIDEDKTEMALFLIWAYFSSYLCNKREGKHLMIGYLFKNFGIEGYWRVDPISKNENVTYNFTPYSVEEIIENSYWY